MSSRVILDKTIKKQKMPFATLWMLIFRVSSSA